MAAPRSASSCSWRLSCASACWRLPGAHRAVRAAPPDRSARRAPPPAAGLAQLLLPELQQRAAGIFQLLLLLQLAVLPFQRLGLSGRRAGQASLLLLQG